MKMEVTLPPVFGRTRQRPVSAKPSAQAAFSSGPSPSLSASADLNATAAPGSSAVPIPIQQPSTTSTTPYYASTPSARFPVPSPFPTPDSDSVKVNIIRRDKSQKGAVRFAEQPAASASTTHLVPRTPDPSLLLDSSAADPSARLASRRHSTTFIDQSSRRLSSTPPALAIRQLRLAFQDTPPMLRQLEDGWRARRSRTMDVSATSIDKPLKSSKSLLRRARTPESTVDPYVLEQMELARRRGGGGVTDAHRSAPGHHIAPDAHRSASGTHIAPLSKADQSANHLGRHSMILDPHTLNHPVQAPLTPPTSPPPLPAISAVNADGLPIQAHRSHASSQQAPDPIHTHGGTETAAPTSPTTAPVQLKPISTSCLPPTKHAVPLHKKSTARITVHNVAHPVSLTLIFQGTTVRVNKAGDEVAISSGPEKQRTRTMLRLADSDVWTEEESQYWLRLLSLVDEYKRRTPKLKVFTEMGDLTISCSDQPDVILVYSIESSHLQLDNLEIVPNSETKVRIRYSNPNEFEIETSSKTKDGGRLKTRRIGPLAKNGTNHRDGDFELFWQASLLGIVIGEDWNEVEKEAVKRLYRVRRDWVKSVRIDDKDD